MKLFTVENLKSLDENSLELGGRNCRDSIAVGDSLSVEARPSAIVKVIEIEVYRRLVKELHHGYVGTLRVEVLSGDGPHLNENLVGL